MKDYSGFYKARESIIEILEKDFMGPVTEDEVLVEYPLQYYIMGKLYPKNDSSEELDMARNPVFENAADTYDSAISLSNQNNPSTMGITCTLLPGVKNLKISFSYAFYDCLSPESAEALGLKLPARNDDEPAPDYVWSRHAYSSEHVVAFDEKGVSIVKLERGLFAKIYTNRILSDTGERVVTVALVNDNQAGREYKEINRLAVFQPEIQISDENGNSIFSSVEKKVNLTTDPELLELDLLYYGVNCYAQGHGCSALWDIENESPVWVGTSFFPKYNLKQMKPASKDLKVFNIRHLYSADGITVVSELREFMALYETWIKYLETESEKLDQARKNSADVNIAKCRYALETITKTIDYLEKDCYVKGNVYRAFQLANEAMYMQRTRFLIRSEKPVEDNEINWYPFQLAFLLQEMYSFIDIKGDERNKVDLLWFPTGGGKTEAYLGIAAFVIFLRRLNSACDDGVTVIMRYTLRLLTLQQFERASMLIFACELLRRREKIGGTEISIGLWVGGKLTPNKLNKARECINKLKDGGVLSGEDENPCQIRICPWCGQPITPNDYAVDMSSERMTIKCSNPDCEFNSFEYGLPIHIIDQALYRHLPAFIVATVDKFAQIPLSDKPAALFGISSHKNPPELIIQDELHLISGPLGTMTGIYEAAITKLCEKEGTGAKVIASTATIRNAAYQIKALYGKEYTQFPPQGITVTDSFFAVESEEQERPARLYCGVMGVGTTSTTAHIRVNAALLFATRYLKVQGYPDNVVDGFWTLVEYFNSLRELGGTSTQILDDVQSRFGYLAKTKFAELYKGVDPDGTYDNYVELTSRMNNEDIVKVIQTGLQRKYPSPDAYDFVLSSNMISVGVDVGRLGMMVVAGQPKSNAEYIQSTSRVGRDNPGMVVTVYNASKSRDRSHYEQFYKYHTALYRYVEATSLTPFSDRARDRGLHALFVGLCRYLVPGLLGEDDAVNFKKDLPEVQNIRNLILNYVAEIDPPEYDAVRDELDEICNEWEYRAIGDLSYRWSNGKSLLKPDTDDDRFRTMNSMRNVDAQSGVYLMGRNQNANA